MKRTRRKTRSDKFPLTLHPTGQYCKKIKGKIRYFGTDKKKAFERYHVYGFLSMESVHFRNGSFGQMAKRVFSAAKQLWRKPVQGCCAEKRNSVETAFNSTKQTAETLYKSVLSLILGAH